MHCDRSLRVRTWAQEGDVAKGTQPVIEPRLAADPPARDTPPLIPELVSGPWIKLPGAQKLCALKWNCFPRATPSPHGNREASQVPSQRHLGVFVFLSFESVEVRKVQS